MDSLEGHFTPWRRSGCDSLKTGTIESCRVPTAAFLRMRSPILVFVPPGCRLQTTTRNVGKLKVDELKDRLLSIHPCCKVQTFQEVYEAATRDKFDHPAYDYVIDASDSFTPKLDLICHGGGEVGATLFGSMGTCLPRRFDSHSHQKSLGRDHSPLHQDRSQGIAAARIQR